MTDEDEAPFCRHTPDRPWGWCPDCGRHDGAVSVYDTVWGYCETHRALWYVGETPPLPAPPVASWARVTLLASYRVTDGWIPTPAMLAGTFTRAPDCRR